jgi:hypothetical protein
VMPVPAAAVNQLTSAMENRRINPANFILSRGIK